MGKSKRDAGKKWRKRKEERARKEGLGISPNKTSPSALIIPSLRPR